MTGYGVEPTIMLHGLLWAVVALAMLTMFVITRRRPDYGLSILIAALPLYQARGHLGVPVTLLELLLLSYVAGVASRRPTFRRTPYDLWLLLWVAAPLLTIFLHPDSVHFLGLWRAFFFEPVLLFYAAAAVVRNGDRRPILHGALGLLAVVTAWSGLQVLTGPGLTYDHRLTGCFQSPNYLAFILTPTILIALLWPERRLGRLRAVLGVFGLVMLVATGSRGGQLALVAGLAAALPFIDSRWRRRGLAALGVIVFIGTALIAYRDAHRPPSEISPRPIIWGVAADEIRQHLLLGDGPGRFQERIWHHYQFEDRTRNLVAPFAISAHNLWLSAWVEWGLFTLVALLGLLGTLVVRLRRGRSGLPAVTAATTAAIVVHGVIDTPVFKNDLAVLFILILVVSLPVTYGGPHADRP